MQLKSLFFTYMECQMFEVHHIRTVQMYNNKHETYLKHTLDQLWLCQC